MLYLTRAAIFKTIRTAELGTDEMLTAVEAALELELHGEIDRILTMRENVRREDKAVELVDSDGRHIIAMPLTFKD